MARKSKNIFTLHGDTIYIRQGESKGKVWNSLGMVTYCEDYYDELTSRTWTCDTKGYLINRNLGGGLHRYVMRKWYGGDVLEDMTARGFVVDHMNNNHMDCRISNLEFLIKDKNTAKGQWVDKYSEKLQQQIALCIFKDFDTKSYQITIGFNDRVCLMNERSGEIQPINTIKLLYNCDYSLVVTDAQAILEEYESQGKITLNYLRFCDKRIEVAPKIKITEDERKRGFVQRNGQFYIIPQKDTCWINEVTLDKGWRIDG